MQGGTSVTQCSLQVWHKRDAVFLEPKSSWSVGFIAPRACASPGGHVAMRLFVRLLDDHVNEVGGDVAE